jgi:hypothetical protein
MGEIVNLRQVKKRRAKAQAEKDAAENTVRHGLTAAQKQANRLAEERRRWLLDGAKKDES